MRGVAISFELYTPHLGDCGLIDSSVATMMHAIRAVKVGRGVPPFAPMSALTGMAPRRRPTERVDISVSRWDMH